MKPIVSFDSESKTIAVFDPGENLAKVIIAYLHKDDRALLIEVLDRVKHLEQQNETILELLRNR